MKVLQFSVMNYTAAVNKVLGYLYNPFSSTSFYFWGDVETNTVLLIGNNSKCNYTFEIFENLNNKNPYRFIPLGYTILR